MTVRALLAGLLLSLIVGAAGPWIEINIQGSNAGGVFFTSPVALFFFLLLVGVVNVILGAIHRPLAFRRGELVGIFVMMTLANAAYNPVHWFTGALTGPFYYATEENNWLHILQPYIKPWIAPSDPNAVSTFYEGRSDGSTAIDWSTWTGPILYWLPLIGAFHGAALCLTVVLRRQWVDQERLIFPIIQMPMAMVQDDERGSLIKPFFRSWIMWFGFAIPMLIGAVRGLHHYYPYLPTIERGTSFFLFHPSLSVPIGLSFATLGFFFFIKREVTFGLWVFFLLITVQKGLYLAFDIGWAKEPAVSAWSYNAPSLVHQSMGGLIVMVLGGLYAGRAHLKDVFRKAFFNAPEVDDGDEIISYRGAVFGLLIGLGIMIFWLNQAGIPLLGVLVFMFFAFVVYISLTRLVAEGGVAVIYPPLVAPDAAVSAMGSAFYGSSGMMGMMYTRVFCNDILNFAMPHFANGLKLADQVSERRTWIFWAMLLGSLAGLASGLWLLLSMIYEHGAINLRHWNYVWMPNYIPDYAASRITEWTGPNWSGWLHTGIGSLVMGLLMLARRLWGWWPLHPIGYPISSTFNWMASNAFFAWVIKGIVLKYGGPSLYRSVRPFFFGLILGQFAIGGIFWIIDSFTGVVGNYLFS